MQEPGEPQFYTFDNRSETIERNETRLAELAAMGQKEFSANLRKRPSGPEKPGHDEDTTASHEEDKDDETTSATQIARSSPTHTSSSPALS